MDELSQRQEKSKSRRNNELSQKTRQVKDNKTRQEKTRQDRTGQDRTKARQDRTGKDRTGQDKGKTRQDKTKRLTSCLSFPLKMTNRNRDRQKLQEQEIRKLSADIQLCREEWRFHTIHELG